MRFLVLFICYLLSVSATYAQMEKSTVLENKVLQYKKLKSAGTTMGVVGGGLTIAGVIMVSNADWELDSSSGGVNYTSEDPSSVFGVLTLMVAVPLTITGIVLNRVGNRKVRQYQNKLENLSCVLSPGYNTLNLNITYKF